MDEMVGGSSNIERMQGKGIKHLEEGGRERGREGEE